MPTGLACTRSRSMTLLPAKPDPSVAAAHLARGGLLDLAGSTVGRRGLHRRGLGLGGLLLLLLLGQSLGHLARGVGGGAGGRGHGHQAATKGTLAQQGDYRRTACTSWKATIQAGRALLGHQRAFHVLSRQATLSLLDKLFSFHNLQPTHAQSPPPEAPTHLTVCATRATGTVKSDSSAPSRSDRILCATCRHAPGVPALSAHLYLRSRGPACPCRQKRPSYITSTGSCNQCGLLFNVNATALRLGPGSSLPRCKECPTRTLCTFHGEPDVPP